MGLLKKLAPVGGGVALAAATREPVREALEGVPLAAVGAGMVAKDFVAPKVLSNVLKRVKGKLAKKALTLPARAIPGVGWGMALFDVLDIGNEFSFLASDAQARKAGFKGGAKQARSQVGSLLAEEIPKWHKGIKKRTKKRIAKRKGKPLFRKSKKDILKSIGRKEGGRVGRPRGVGAALRGYGKAMRNG
jgi:hypothetical protein